MAQVRRTTQASLDLLDILTYLGDRSPDAAERFALDMERRGELLARFPDLGSPCEEVGPGVRAFVSGRYVIYYRAAADGIEIIRVLHGSRNFPPSRQ
jgi:toxin ParE1/3/4